MEWINGKVAGKASRDILPCIRFSILVREKKSKYSHVLDLDEGGGRHTLAGVKGG